MRQPYEEAHPPQGIFVGGRRDLCPPATFPTEDRLQVQNGKVD